MAVVTTSTDVTAIDLGCGHRIYLADDFIRERKRDHKTFYCSVCGDPRHYPGESDVERLKRQLTTTRDMLDTARENQRHTEHRLRAQKGVTTRIKNRVSKGVCPCCNRTFQDLQRHMASKHPDYTKSV